MAADRLWWSDEVFAILGLDPSADAPSLERFVESLHPDDRDLVAVPEADAFAGLRDEYAVRHRIVRPDGRSATSVNSRW